MADGTTAPAEIRRDLLDAVIFDLDGVITDTASVHASAWKRVFDSFLADRVGEEDRPFSAQDYLRYVDGKPRYDGVESFLASRGYLPAARRAARSAQRRDRLRSRQPQG